jgi:hypothetical protein
MIDKMRRSCGTNSYQHSIGDNTFLTDPNFEPLRPMASFGSTFRCAKIFGWQGWLTRPFSDQGIVDT